MFMSDLSYEENEKKNSFMITDAHVVVEFSIHLEKQRKHFRILKSSSWLDISIQIVGFKIFLISFLF